MSVSLPLSNLFRGINDEFLIKGKSPTSSIRVFLDGDLPASFPTDLSRLESLCQQAPFGRGSDTVLDTDVRRVFETDRCRVEAPVGEILAEVARRFSLPEAISAQFYKLLYYRKGDFFLEHVDR